MDLEEHRSCFILFAQAVPSSIFNCVFKEFRREYFTKGRRKGGSWGISSSSPGRLKDIEGEAQLWQHWSLDSFLLLMINGSYFMPPSISILTMSSIIKKTSLNTIFKGQKKMLVRFYLGNHLALPRTPSVGLSPESCAHLWAHKWT